MKITRLKTWQVPPRWLFLKVETDVGCFGWGEPVVEGRAATVEAAVHELADYLIGQDPHRIEHLWNTLYRAGFYRGGPILMSAIAGIDQALWDLKGRDLGVPVHQLLGGAVRDKMRMYAWTGGDRPHDVNAGAKAQVAQGFTAFKMNGTAELAIVDSHARIDEAVARVAEAREAVGPWGRTWALPSTFTDVCIVRWPRRCCASWSPTTLCSSRSRSCPSTCRA